jgi:hypothetical protein
MKHILMWVRRSTRQIWISEIFHIETFGTFLSLSCVRKPVTDLPQGLQAYPSLELYRLKIGSLSQDELQSDGSK